MFTSIVKIAEKIKQLDLFQDVFFGDKNIFITLHIFLLEKCILLNHFK
jgi:hypothetical protein